MKIIVLKKDDNWNEVRYKLYEECTEAQDAIINLMRYEKNNKFEICQFKKEIASEILDVIQVCIGALDKLEMDLNIKKEMKKHCKKLISRGWKIKKMYSINRIYSRNKKNSCLNEWSEE